VLTSHAPAPRPLGGVRTSEAAVIGTFAALVGWAIVLGHPWAELVAAAVLLFAVAAPARWRAVRLGSSFLAIELPILLLLFLDVYYPRTRTATDLAGNPLDAGGMVKLAAVGLAILIGGLAFATSTAAPRPTTTPFRLFVLYVVVVFFGAWSSVDPLLTTFRGLEVAAAVVVVAGAYRRYGQVAVARVERLLYVATVALVLSVWVGVVVAKSEALVPTPKSPLPSQIQGVYPMIASNGVGTLGVILALWSLARLVSRSPRERMRRPVGIALTALGVVTLLAAQYRTGYAAFAAGAALLLALRGRKTLAAVIGLFAAVAMYWGLATVGTSTEPLLLRGDTPERASQLSGRLDMWHAAIPFWHESPIFGRGLLTSTRLEVLPSIGLENTATIHGTWIETLVGTGLVGTALLAAALVLLLYRGVVDALRRNGRVVPAVLAVSLIVRSFTGSSVESLGIGVLLLVVFALALAPEPRTQRVRLPRQHAALPARVAVRP
jgi:O-antigen ligase